MLLPLSIHWEACNANSTFAASSLSLSSAPLLSTTLKTSTTSFLSFLPSFSFSSSLNLSFSSLLNFVFTGNQYMRYMYPDRFSATDSRGEFSTSCTVIAFVTLSMVRDVLFAGAIALSFNASSCCFCLFTTQYVLYFLKVVCYDALLFWSSWQVIKVRILP